MSLNKVLFPDPFRPTRTTLLFRVRSSVTPSNSMGFAFGAVDGGLDAGIKVIPEVEVDVGDFPFDGVLCHADFLPATSPPFALPTRIGTLCIPGREGNAKETLRHWTSEASAAQARGVMSGNLKTVSLST